MSKRSCKMVIVKMVKMMNCHAW